MTKINLEEFQIGFFMSAAIPRVLKMGWRVGVVGWGWAKMD